MRIANGLFLACLCLNIQISYSQDYFNPMFLGKDVASIDDLAYITSGNVLSPGNYYLALYVGESLIKNININFENSNEEEKVEACFTKEIIDLIPFNETAKKEFNFTHSKPNECIDIKKYIKNFSYDVELSKLIINLSIPQIYLDSVNSTLAKEKDWDDGIPFFLMNYNFNGSYSKNKNTDDYSSYYLSLNNKFNLHAWRLNSNIYFNENKIGSVSNKDVAINNIYLSRNINAIKSNLVIGQNILGSSLFDSNPYIGVTLATSTEMLPDSDRGYSPSIKGIADSKSKLTIKQNNNIIYQTYINPGPYDINNLNSVGTSGDYEVELTTSDGIVKKYIVPYASLPNLLRTGKFNYSITAGKLDLNVAKNKNFIQSTIAIGVPLLESTIFTGTQLSADYKSAALGIGKDLGLVGALSVDATHAKAEINNKIQSGESYRILYSKSFSDIGTNIQLTGYRYSTSDYYSLSEASYRNNLINNDSNYLYQGRRKDSFQINLSQNLNDYGQAYIWGNLNSYWGQKEKSKNIQIGWNKTIKQLNNVIVSASYNKNNSRGFNDDALYLSLSLPISNGMNNNLMYLSNSTSYNNSSYNNLTSVSGNLLDNKLDYNVYQVVNKNENNTNINLNYKANFINLNAGTNYTSNSKQINYGASGGVLFHQDGIVFAREAYDTAILVEAKGATGAKINKSGGDIIINNSGYALIPYATPYHYNDVELDPSTFGNNYDIENKVLKISPTRGAISKVIFDVKKGYNFLVTVRHKDELIKFGSLVKNNDDKTISIANDDGSVYLTGVKNKSNYSVSWGDGITCNFLISYDENEALNTVNKRDVNCL